MVAAVRSIGVVCACICITLMLSIAHTTSEAGLQNSLYDELRPLKLQLGRYQDSIICTITYTAKAKPEILWFKGEGTRILSFNVILKGEGFSQAVIGNSEFGYILLQPVSKLFYIYVHIPMLNRHAESQEYGFQQMDLSLIPGHDLTSNGRQSPNVTVVSNRVMGDVQVSEFVDSFFYNSQDLWIYDVASFMNSDNHNGPIKHLRDEASATEQRFKFRVESAFADLPPQGFSIFNVMPATMRGNESVIQYQIVVFVSFHRQRFQQAPFPPYIVQFIESKCDRNRTCQVASPCRISCLAVGNEIETIEISKRVHGITYPPVTSRDTVYFQYHADASFVVNNPTSGESYEFKVIGKNYFSDTFTVHINVEDKR